MLDREWTAPSAFGPLMWLASGTPPAGCRPSHVQGCQIAPYRPSAISYLDEQTAQGTSVV